MKKIMLTGATGYVGGHLLGQLLKEGHEVHVLARNPSKIEQSHPNLLCFSGDVRNPAALKSAMAGCEVAYYLVHGLSESDAFEHQEAVAAETFARVSNDCGVSKIIYLGGLGEGTALSPHLRSRHLTGRILSLSKAKVLEFRASIVLGQGSTSYEMIKSLVSRLPFFVDPPNLRALCQPIYIDDLLQYLVQGLEFDLPESRVIEIGGLERISYPQLLLRVARHSKIDRKVIPVPEIEPKILAEIFELVCPEYARVGRHLMESLTHATVLRSNLGLEAFPQIQPRGIDTSLDLIGTIQSDVRSLISKEHTLAILKALGGRFPKSKWIQMISERFPG